jgi:hypothetical protein
LALLSSLIIYGKFSAKFEGKMGSWNELNVEGISLWLSTGSRELMAEI